jgi:hypothetical protein
MSDQSKPRRPIWRWVNMAFALAGLLFGSIIAAPQLLAFPYQVQMGDTRVYSESPLSGAALRPVLARANRLLTPSPLYRGPVGTRIFLTEGGWRWRVLALNSAGSVGFTRPLSDLVSDAVIIGPSNVLRDQTNSVRSLSGTIAHERTHIMVRRHLGVLRGVMLPAWISEGYADHVAGEPDAGDPDLARWRAAQPDHPVFFYIEARQRVEAALAANGDDVEALLHSE